MPVIVESDVTAIIGIDAGRGNNGAAEVAADVFYNAAGVTEVWLCIDIETVFIFFVDGSFRFFEGGADTGFQFIEEGSLEGLAEVGVVEVFHVAPGTVIRESAFGKEAVDMGIPFEGPAESMEDTDKTGDKIFAFVQLVEHPEDDAADGTEKAVKERTILQEERAECFVNGKNEMPVRAVDKLKRHFCGAFNAVFVAAGRAESGMAAERDEFEFAAVGTGIHGTAKRGVPAVYHFLHVFHNNGAWMEDIFNFFIMFFKNLLDNVHKSIMQEMWGESKPTPQD